MLVVLLAAAFLWGATQPGMEAPRADALRYLDYTANVLEHGTFGRSSRLPEPQAGRENMPLYPLFLAAVLRAAGTAPAELRCFFTAGDCNPDVLAGVWYAQLGLALIAAAGVWMLGWQIGGRRGAWLTLTAAVLSGQLTEYTAHLLTENITVPCWAWLGVAMLALREGGAARYVGLGLMLSVLTMTRPEFLYLACAFILVVTLSGLINKPRAAGLRRGALVFAGVLVLCAPWLVRNTLQFGDPALTQTYGAHIIAQRVQYNRMSLAELGVSFVYWLPDFGDSLAERLFPAWTWERLNFAKGSYYRDGQTYRDQVEARIGDPTAVQATILREDVLGQPLKHAAVTVALAWRGIFVAKLWGMLGLIAFMLALWRRKALRRTLLLLAWPPWFMLGLYAAVSVSIPRYAICFVPLFALSMAVLLTPPRTSSPGS